MFTWAASAFGSVDAIQYKARIGNGATVATGAVLASEDYVNATETAKIALMAAFDAAKGIASVDVAGNVTRA